MHSVPRVIHNGYFVVDISACTRQPYARAEYHYDNDNNDDEDGDDEETMSMTMMIVLIIIILHSLEPITSQWSPVLSSTSPQPHTYIMPGALLTSTWLAAGAPPPTYRVIHQTCQSPFSSSLPCSYTKSDFFYIDILKDHIFKFFRFCVLHKECQVEILTSVIQMRTLLFTLNSLADIFF